MRVELAPERGSGVGAGDGTRPGTGEVNKRPAETPGQGGKVRSIPAQTGRPRSEPPKAGPGARGGLLALLAAARVATTEQCRRLVTPDATTPRYVLRALTELAAEGMVLSVPFGRARHRVWALTDKGARAYADAGLGPRPHRPAASVLRTGLLRHAVAVTGVIAAMAPAGAELADWSIEVAHRFGVGPQGRLVTDAVLHRPADTDELPPVVLVELDRATMSVDRLLGELVAYHQYASTWVPRPYSRRNRCAAPQRDYPVLGYGSYSPKCPPILVVIDAPHDVVERRAIRLMDRLGRGVTDLLDIGLVRAEALTQRGPLARIITPADDMHARLTLAELPGRPRPKRDSWT